VSHPVKLANAHNRKKLFRREPSEAASSGRPPLGSTSILSLDFDNEGGLLLTSESDNSMQIYNVKEGKHHKTLLSQKYGTMHAMFAHAPGTIIHSSTKVNRKPNFTDVVRILLINLKIL
jgi:COMPASS component SWD2